MLGTELDPVAAACARGNGVRVAEVAADGVPISWLGTVDVIVGVLPYVPTGSLVFLPRDVRDFEPQKRWTAGPTVSTSSGGRSPEPVVGSGAAATS